jgi:sec-independent protein translocase protein TatC
LIATVVIPIVVLFLAGAIFSYVLIVPVALEFLYSFAGALPIETFVTVTELVGFVMTFVLGVGLSFELPVIMYVLTKMGVVDTGFWRRNIRYAIFGAAVYGAIITPDGSGVTMFMVAAPMIVLYLAGYVFLAVKNRKPKVST